MHNWQFRFHRNESSDIAKVDFGFESFKNISDHPAFDGSKKTILLIHGYTSSPSADPFKFATKSLLNRDDFNVILLNWSQLVNGTYEDAISNMLQVK